jgi:hypothetical protein
MVKPTRTPATSPTLPMSSPPRGGASTMGRRLRIDWTVKPMARRSGGRLSPMRAKVAGRARLDHAMVKASPTKTNGQLGLTR